MKTFKLYHGLALLMLLTLGLALVASCASNGHPPDGRSNRADVSARPHPYPELDKITAVLWFQYAAEARALYYQAFNIASNRLADAIATNCACAKLAVIMDIDETLLNNSPFQAALIEKETNFNSPDWKTWQEKAHSEPLPGATNFLQYAARCNVDIFYLSNRKTNEWDATKANLDTRGFPMVDKDHLLLLQHGDNGKESRRRYIESHYKVVLLMGDSLYDFSTVFDAKSIGGRFKATDMNYQKFGNEFIILPNPVYGDWETPLYTNQNQLSEQDKADIRWQMLQKLARPANE